MQKQELELKIGKSKKNKTLGMLLALMECPNYIGEAINLRTGYILTPRIIHKLKRETRTKMLGR